jgi:pimeloyl-ACP methyl ester carboxylesterase
MTDDRMGGDGVARPHTRSGRSPELAGAEATTELVRRLDAEARRIEVRGGHGSTVWRSWGEGPALVLLHGGAGSWQHWVCTVPAFRGARHVLAPDLPGFGESSNPPPPADMPAIAAVLAAGIDQVLGPHASYDVVGFSFGASVGGHLALVHGDRVRSLTLVGAGGLVRPRIPVVLERVRGRQGEALRQAHRTNLERIMIGDPARIDALALAIQDWNSRHARFDSPALIVQRPLAQSLPRLRVPVNAIWGEHDQVAYYTIEDRVAALRALCPTVAVRIIPGVGHWAAYERPEAFAATLAELLQRKGERPCH